MEGNSTKVTKIGQAPVSPRKRQNETQISQPLKSPRLGDQVSRFFEPSSDIGFVSYSPVKQSRHKRNPVITNLPGQLSSGRFLLPPLPYSIQQQQQSMTTSYLGKQKVVDDSSLERKEPEEQTPRLVKARQTWSASRDLLGRKDSYGDVFLGTSRVIKLLAPDFVIGDGEVFDIDLGKSNLRMLTLYNPYEPLCSEHSQVPYYYKINLNMPDALWEALNIFKNGKFYSQKQALLKRVAEKFIEMYEGQVCNFASFKQVLKAKISEQARGQTEEYRFANFLKSGMQESYTHFCTLLISLLTFYGNLDDFNKKKMWECLPKEITKDANIRRIFTLSPQVLLCLGELMSRRKAAPSVATATKKEELPSPTINQPRSIGEKYRQLAEGSRKKADSTTPKRTVVKAVQIPAGPYQTKTVLVPQKAIEAFVKYAYEAENGPELREERNLTIFTGEHPAAAAESPLTEGHKRQDSVPLAQNMFISPFSPRAELPSLPPKPRRFSEQQVKGK